MRQEKGKPLLVNAPQSIIKQQLKCHCKGWGGIGLRYTVLFPYDREKSLEQCQHWLWLLEKRLLEASDFRDSL